MQLRMLAMQQQPLIPAHLPKHRMLGRQRLILQPRIRLAKPIEAGFKFHRFIAVRSRRSTRQSKPALRRAVEQSAFNERPEQPDKQRRRWPITAINHFDPPREVPKHRARRPVAKLFASARPRRLRKTLGFSQRIIQRRKLHFSNRNVLRINHSAPLPLSPHASLPSSAVSAPSAVETSFVFLCAHRVFAVNFFLPQIIIQHAMQLLEFLGLARVHHQCCLGRVNHDDVLHTQQRNRVAFARDAQRVS